MKTIEKLENTIKDNIFSTYTQSYESDRLQASTREVSSDDKKKLFYFNIYKGLERFDYGENRFENEDIVDVIENTAYILKEMHFYVHRVSYLLKLCLNKICAKLKRIR